MKDPLTQAASQKHPEPQWLSSVLNYYWLHDVLHIYVGLSIWVIRWDDENHLRWMEMTPESSSRLSPVHFEKFFRRAGERDAYYFKCLKRLEKEGGVLVDQLGGFYDFFLPLQLKGTHRAALYANYFLKEPPKLDSLKLHWRKMTGREPSGGDPDFLLYVRMALNLPVLNGTLLKGMTDFLKYYADFLTGRGISDRLHEKVDQLRRKVFAAELPNTAWVQEALGVEKFIPTPWDWYAEPQLAPWMKEELGITRIPTVAIAAMPLKQGPALPDPAEALVQGAAIQRECFGFAKTIPQTVAGKLQDYGTIFLTSADPGKGETQAKLQIRDRAEKIRDFIRKRFGVKAAVGIGRPVTSGDALYHSYREAVLALHLCAQTEKNLMFYDESPEAAKGRGYYRVHGTGQDLLAAFGKLASESLKLASDRYVREVLEFAGREPAVVRSQFLSILFRLLEGAEARSALNPDDTKGYAEDFSRKVEDADSIYRLIEVFKQTLQTLSHLTAKPLEGAKNLRMETTLKFLEGHLDQPLRLPQVAKQSGFSVPVFCRLFKKTTGLSFVAYLNQLRVEQAKRLLKISGLNVLQIGQACGFQTPHHFIRNFKHLTGVTPGDFRKKQVN